METTVHLQRVIQLYIPQPNIDQQMGMGPERQHRVNGWAKNHVERRDPQNAAGCMILFL